MDDIIVWPIAHTEVDWSFYNKFCIANLGYSPTKVLDNFGVDPKTPSSFLATLGQESPQENLRKFCKKNGAWNHSMFTVGGRLDSDALIELSSSDLYLLPSLARKDYCIIISGTIHQWYDACILLCQIEFSFEVRFLMNQCFNHLIKLGYKDLFEDYERVSHTDKTILLRSPCN